jgi:CheY-like chemotaxis protein
MMVILNYAVKLLNCDVVCDKAINGKKALDMIIKNVEDNQFEICNYELILMDCNMPFMDGYQAT